MGILAALVVFAAGASGMAADFPTRPIEIVIPYAPGGGSDVTARVLAKYMEQQLGQPVVVTNITGAQGKIGEMEVLNAAPDGYKLLWQHHVMHALYLTGVTDYTWRDFTPIGVGGYSDNALLVRADAPWNSIHDLLKDAEAQPGKLVWEFAPGTTNHFGVLQILSGSPNARFNLVPKSGDNPRVVALMGGHSDVTIVALNAAIPFAESGDIKILATLGEERSQWVPDVPTLKEQGVDAELYNEYVLYAPKGLPANVEETLRNAFEAAMTNPDLIAEFEGLATVPNFMDKEATFERLDQIFSTFERLAKEFNIYRP